MSRRNPGEGSIGQRPNGTWCATLQVDGERIFRYARTEKEARAKLLALQKDANVNGILASPGRKTVNDLLDSWLAHVAPTLKPRTVADYRGACDRYLRPHIGTVRLSRLSAEQVQAVYARLQKTGARRVPSYAHAVLHRACKVAVLWGWLPQNPCDRVLKPSHEAERRDVWTPENLRTFLDGTAGNWLRPLWVMAAATGCRLGELLALRWQDVDWAGPSIAICRNVQWIAKEMVFCEPKSGFRTLSA